MFNIFSWVNQCKFNVNQRTQWPCSIANCHSHDQRVPRKMMGFHGILTSGIQWKHSEWEVEWDLMAPSPLYRSMKLGMPLNNVKWSPSLCWLMGWFFIGWIPHNSVTTILTIHHDLSVIRCVTFQYVIKHDWLAIPPFTSMTLPAINLN